MTQRWRINWFAVALALPMPVWQTLFFVAALAFLVVMSFWSVESFRLVPDVSLANWVKMYRADYFRDTYGRTVLYATLAAALASLIAFPCAYGLAFNVSPPLRRFAVFSLITPYFTSYLVRAYAWKIVLTEKGVINTMLGWVGLGPFPMSSNLFATLVGYLTLILPIVILLQYFSLVNVDRSLIEAAHNLGCRRLRTVFRLIIPEARIGLILAATFAFILSFGDFVSPSFLGGNKPPTLSILMVDAVKSGSQWPRAAVVALTMVLTLLVVAFVSLTFAYGRGRRRA
jgi:spermidine/putrescine transport system permease protein